MIDAAAVRTDGWAGGVYASLEWPVNDRLSLQPGLRWDIQDYSDDKSYIQTAPRLGLIYSLNADSRVRLSLGRFYQAEDLHELQFLDGETDFFRPQHADQAIIAYHWQNSPYRFIAEAWYKRYDDQKRRYENLYNTFVLMPYTEPDRVSVDPERAYARGIDLEFGYDNQSSLAASVRYSYLEAEDRIDGTWVPRRWSQRHTFGLQAWWRRDRLTLSAALTLHSGWRSSEMPEEFDADEVLEIASVLNNFQLREYLSLDLGARYTWRLPNSEISFHAALTNVFDRNNVAGLDYDIEEEDGVVSFARNRDTLLPFIPSLGITIAF